MDRGDFSDAIVLAATNRVASSIFQPFRPIFQKTDKIEHTAGGQNREAKVCSAQTAMADELSGLMQLPKIKALAQSAKLKAMAQTSATCRDE